MRATCDQPRGADSTRALLLGRYDAQQAAAAALADAHARGERGVKLVSLPATVRYALRVMPVDAALRDRLQALALPNAGAGFAPCTD